MKLTLITADNLKSQEVDTSKTISIVVRIGNVNYTLSERKGALRISVDDQLVARPISSNALTLSTEI